MIAPPYDDRLEAVAPMASSLLRTFSDGEPEGCGGRPKIAVVGLGKTSAKILEQVLPATWDGLEFRTAQSFLASAERAGVDCAVAEFEWSDPGALGMHRTWWECDPWATTVLFSETAWPDELYRCFTEGAIRILRRPWETARLSRILDEAQRRGERRRNATLRRRQWAEHLATLTPVERQVIDCLYQGHPHKRIAARVGMSLRMVDYRRKCAMQKLKVDTLAGLVRMLAELEFAETWLDGPHGATVPEAGDSPALRQGSSV